MEHKKVTLKPYSQILDAYQRQTRQLITASGGKINRGEFFLWDRPPQAERANQERGKLEKSIFFFFMDINIPSPLQAYRGRGPDQ